MEKNEWITTNYSKIRKICEKYNVGIDTDDLFQSCVEQMLNNKHVWSLDEKQRIYYFARIVMNNARSNSSPFYNENRKFKFTEWSNKQETIDEQTDDEYIDMDWINNELKQIMDVEWYYGRLFQLYIQEGCSITNLSKRTTIPTNSVSRDINKVRKILIERRKKFLYGL